MKVESTVYPSPKENLKGKILVNFDVEEVTNVEGEVKYVYQQLRFTPPMTDEALDKEVAKYKEANKPKVVSMRQARLALLQINKLSVVDAALAALPSPDKEAAQIEWEYAQEVARVSPLVTQLGQALGLTDTDLDTLFLNASKL